MKTDLISWIFPRQCIVCATMGEYLCKTCKKKLEPHPEICPYCHKFSPDYATCITCRTDKNNHLEGIIIPFAYTSVLKTLIIKLKYFHKKDISNFLIDRLDIALQTNQTLQRQQYKHPQTFITYIPSHWTRKYIIKGYNQSEVLANKLSQKIHIPMLPIATKNKRTKTQASLDRNGRLHNLTNAFSLNKNLPLSGNETLLIIDDITTT